MPPNTILTAKLFSLEMLGVVVMAALSLAGVWFSLVSRVDASDTVIQGVDKSVKEVQETQKTQAASIQNIEKTMEVMVWRMKVAEENDKVQTQRTEEIIGILKKEYFDKQ